MKKAKKLSLKNETIRNLSSAQLVDAAGGGYAVYGGGVAVQSSQCNVAGGNMATSGSITSEYGGYILSGG